MYKKRSIETLNLRKQSKPTPDSIGISLSPPFEAMERFGFNQARMSMLLIRAPKQVERCMSKLAQKIPTSEKHKEHYSIKGGYTGGPSRWVPHPRTGIYYPTGHEQVMDDVPDGAASFVESHWLRNTDGVDQKPEAADALFPCNPVTLTKT